jgi:phage-related protein
MVRSGPYVKPKPIGWLGDSFEILREFPKPVRRRIGFSLREAQEGSKSTHAKPLTGFGGAAVLEVVDDFDGNAYRAVYTVRFAERIYVLHVFQKKSHRGSALPRRDIALIRQRLAQAQEDSQRWRESYTSARRSNS